VEAFSIAVYPAIEKLKPFFFANFAPLRLKLLLSLLTRDSRLLSWVSLRFKLLFFNVER